uniref:Uncharacterized protein n=1 Tax=Anguilla anguilla TaxID=7936 RepID=A0A0E9U7L3_ANGAN
MVQTQCSFKENVFCLFKMLNNG